MGLLAALGLGALALWLLRTDADVPVDDPIVTPRPALDAERTVADVERQVAFGPRVPGTEAHAAQLRWMVGRLDSLSLSPEVQPVAFADPADSTRIFRGANVLARFRPDAPRRVLLAAHWDSRPVADADPDPARRADPVPGANDGASGVAVLLEVARLLATSPPADGLGVDLVLFDLEDLGETTGDSLDVPYAAGSELFAQANPAIRPDWGILLDMVGDRDLRLPREGYSQRYAPAVVDRVWAAARRVGATAFQDEVGAPIQDDHIAFLGRGIPVIDLIHSPFPDTWHTTADLPDRVAPESLEQVGRVVVEAIWAYADEISA